MARKLSLKNINFNNAMGNNQPFNYGEVMIQILKDGRGGVSLDEMIKVVSAIRPIEVAVSHKNKEVTLDEEQYRTLRGKLDTFQFGFTDPIIVEFGMMIRDAPEVGTEADRPRRVS